MFTLGVIAKHRCHEQDFSMLRTVEGFVSLWEILGISKEMTPNHGLRGPRPDENLGMTYTL